MPKKGKGSIIGLVGGVLIGAAILLFVVTLVLNQLKSASAINRGNDSVPDFTESAAFNTTVDQISTMMTVAAILLAVMGIVIVGSQIIAYIGGGFGG